MRKKLAAILLLCVSAATLLAACAPQKNDGTAETAAVTYADYMGTDKRIAVQAGDVYGDVAMDLFAAAEAREYTTVADSLEALRMGRADAVLLSHGYVRQLQDSGMYPDFDYLWVPKEVYVNEAGPIFHTEALRDQYDEWFAGIVEDGTWQEIVDRWIGVPLPAQEDIPQFEFTGENGVLKVCDTGNYPPLIYFDANNEPTGFDVEIVSLFAQHMGMRPEFAMMSYEAVVPYVTSGKADMSASTLTITDEREDGMIFGAPSVITQAVLVVPGQGGASAEGGLRTYEDLEGKMIGVTTGSFFDTVTEASLHATPVYFSNESGSLEDLKKGRIDGVMLDYSTALVVGSQPGNEMLEIIRIPTEVHSGPMGAISIHQELIDRFNAFLREIEEEGLLADMQQRWILEDPGSDPPMPEIPPSTGENGELKAITTGITLPFSYVGADGELKGYCIELALRFAAREGLNITFETSDFSGVIPSVISGKSDIGIDSIAITEERKQSVLFSEPHYYDQLGVMVLKTSAADAADETDGGFIGWLKTAVERNLLTDNRWRMIVDGLGVTMTIALLSQLFGTVLGAFVCFMITRKNRFIKWLGNLYCGLIHGLPVVVILMVTYYIIFGSTTISNVLVAVAAFTMVTAAGIAETLKGAIDTVDPVEIEAARSIGFSALKAFLTVTLPQAVKRALPGYTNGFVELVKSTAIVGYVAIQDMMRAGDIIRSRTYDAYFPLLFVAAIYLLVTTVFVQVFKLIVKRINGELI